MTIISELTDPEELKRYEDDFAIIVDYLRNRRLEIQMKAIGRQSGSDWHKDMADQLWESAFTDWMRDCLERNL